MTDRKEDDLLLRVAAGDQQAFKELIFSYSERVFLHTLTFVKSWHEAEEIVQDIFLRIWQKRERLNTVKDWDNYLFILSRNFLINTIRKKAKSFEVAEIEDIEDKMLSPDNQYINKELHILLQKAISSLPEKKRLIFEMIHLQGVSQEKVAQKLGIATRTVRWNLVSAINEIRDFIHRYSVDMLLLFCLIYFS